MPELIEMGSIDLVLNLIFACEWIVNSLLFFSIYDVIFYWDGTVGVNGDLCGLILSAWAGLGASIPVVHLYSIANDSGKELRHCCSCV